MPDPYTPPPRYRERSGPLLRVVIIAALLGVAVWGYTAYEANNQTASLAPAEDQQQLADSSADRGYAVSPQTSAAPPAATPEATPAAPASPPPASPPAQERPRTPAPEPVPPPSTSIEPSATTPPAG